MKKRLSVLILVVVLLVITSSAALAARYVSGTSWLKVHTEPRDSASVIGSFRTDYAVTSYKKYDSNWAYVTFSSGDTGYVRTKYLKTSSKSTAYVKADETVLRKGPAATFSSVATLSKGTKVTVVTSGSNWSYVSTPSGKGYIRRSGLSSKYVKPTVKKAPYTAYLVSSNGKKINVRRGGGAAYALVLQAPSGTKVSVIEKGTSWSKVKVGSLTGYVQNTYVSKTLPAATTTGTTTSAKTYTAYIVSSNGKKVNVRRGAGTGYAVNGQLESGTKVTVIQDTSSAKWTHITSGTVRGYVQNQYISKKAPKAATSTTTVTSGKTYSAYITSTDGKKVNVRRAAGTGYASVGKLDHGTKITVLGHEGRWYHIQSGSLKGYVRDDYISMKKPKAITTTTSTGTTVKGKTKTVKSPDNEKVNMRRGPGTGYARVAQLKVGTKVTVIGTQGKWSKVIYNGITGYIKTEYLK